MTQNSTRFLHIMGFVLLGASLSGCSLIPQSLTQKTVTQPGVFQSKPSAGSIWKSSDGGESFEPKVTVDETHRITSADVLSIAFLSPDPNEGLFPSVAPGIFVGTATNGIFKSEDGAEQWEAVNFPPQKVYSFTVARKDPNRMYATGVLGERGKIFRTTDGGENWEEVYSEPGTGTVIVSLAEHPLNTEILFAGTSAGTVVKSMDGGETWKNVGQQVNGPVTAIKFDAVKPLSVYLIVHSKKMYYSSNGGEEWLDWEAKAIGGRTVAPRNAGETGTQQNRRPSGVISLAPDPTISGTVYVGTNTGLFRSRNYGESFEEINIIESAKKFPLRVIAVNPKNSDEIVFASGKAFYKSINGGLTWSVSQLNIDRDVSALAYDPFDPSVLYIGLRKY